METTHTGDLSPPRKTPAFKRNGANGHANGRELVGMTAASPEQPTPFRQAPHNLEAEQALLGAILVNNEAMDKVSSFLEAHHLFDPLHQQIFETAAKLIGAGKRADPITLRTFFERAEPISPNLTVPQYLGTLAAKAVTIINAADYGRTIFDLATRRALIIIGEDMATGAYDSPVDSDPRTQMETALQRLDEARAAAYGDAAELFDMAGTATLDRVAEPLIENILSISAAAVLVAPWQSGKTHVVVRAGYSIANGRPFMGRKTQQGAVLFVPLEGRGGFTKRLVAANHHYGNPGERIAVLREVGSLGPQPGSDAFVGKIIAAAKALARRAGCPVRLIAIDTLAKALGGADENAAATMAAVWMQVARIIKETGATVLFTHHPPHGDSKRPRGTGDIMGGADEVLRIDREENAAVRELHTIKLRDGETGLIGRFTLPQVEIGIDANGRPITTCIVKPTDAPAAPKKAKRPRQGTQAATALNELEHLIIDGKSRVSNGHQRIPDGAHLVEIEDWRRACRDKQLSDGGDPEAERQAFHRAVRDMSRTGFLSRFGASVWITGHVSSAASEGSE